MTNSAGKQQNPNSGDMGTFGNLGRKLDERLRSAAPIIEREIAHAQEELQRVLTHLNDEVVPEARRHSSQALRAAAESLSKLASQLDDTGRPPKPPPSSPSGPKETGPA